MGTVLVIGGCGFVGSRLVDQLLNFPSEDESAPDSSTRTSAPSSSDSITISSSQSYPSLRSRYPSHDPSTTTVHALDLRCTHNRYPGCTYHEADITSEEQLSAIFDKVKPDVVINTASPHFDAPEPILRKVNIEGTKTLISVAQSRAKIFVHVSSSSVVHDTFSDLFGATEEYPYVDPNPRERYSETKVKAERIVLAANNTATNFLTCAVRPAGITGEGDRNGIGYSLCAQAATAPPATLRVQLGDNSNLFDTTYVGNVSYGLLCAASALLATHSRIKAGQSMPLDSERVDGEAFNVTNDSPLPFWDICRYIWSRYGTNPVITPESIWTIPKEYAVALGFAAESWAKLTGRKGRFNSQTARYACMHRWFRCEKLEQRTGYQPIVGVEEALGRTIKWFKAQEEQEKAANGKAEKKTQ